MSLSKLSVELFNSVMDSRDLLHHLDVSRVVAVLNLWSMTSLLQSSLRNLQWWTLGSDGSLHLVNVLVLVLDLLLDHVQLGQQLLPRVLALLGPLLECLVGLVPVGDQLTAGGVHQVLHVRPHLG